MSSERQDTEHPPNRPVIKARGETAAERHVARLCESTFLSLWSYPGLYRDQRSGPTIPGKELADLIVVFEDQIIVFSDKDCAVPNTGNRDLDWRRWFRRAVATSAEQAWGAERWLRQFPNRVFLDAQCTERFPLPVPNSSETKFHLIVVAHDIAQRCAKELGGSGSLMLRNTVQGIENHVIPFTIGDLEPERTFVHVLDDTSLAIVVKTLDTIADFTAYLTKKEIAFRSSQMVSAAGEEELLAWYLTRTNEHGEHDFAFPPDKHGVLLTEGLWELFEKAPQRRAQVQANEVSYSWVRSGDIGNNLVGGHG